MKRTIVYELKDGRFLVIPEEVPTITLAVGVIGPFGGPIEAEQLAENFRSAASTLEAMAGLPDAGDARVDAAQVEIRGRLARELRKRGVETYPDLGGACPGWVEQLAADVEGRVV